MRILEKIFKSNLVLAVVPVVLVLESKGLHGDLGSNSGVDAIYG